MSDRSNDRLEPGTVSRSTSRLDAADSVVTVDDVAVWFGDVEAVRGLTLRVEPGDRLAVVGQTGAGKSTFMNLLVGALAPTSGTVRVVGKDPYRDHDALQGLMSLAFQTPRLLGWRTAEENVAVGLEILGVPRKERRERSQEWLSRVGLGHATKRYPSQLSGGMQQRVSLARAFVIEPQLILLDEAFSALDEVTATTLRTDFVELCEATGTTSVLVTHSIEEAFTVGTNVVVFASPAQIVGRYDAKDHDLSDSTTMAALREEVRTRMAQHSLNAPQPPTPMED